MPSTAGRIHYKTAPGQLTFDEEAPQGPPTIETPFQEDSPAHVVITQRYVQRGECYRRPPDNQLCPPQISNRVVAWFCEDSPREPVGVADLVTWNRTWANKPATITQYEQLAVQMPALAACYFFDIGTAGGEFNHFPYIYAKAYSLNARATILRAFFLIGTGTGADYSTPTSIPALNEAVYTAPDVTARGAGPFDNDAWDEIVNGSQNIGNFSGAVRAPATGNPISGSTTTYASQLAAGDYYVGQSQLRRYLGNIWERTATRITL